MAGQEEWTSTEPVLTGSASGRETWNVGAASRTIDPDVALHGRDQAVGDVQAEAGAAVAPGQVVAQALGEARNRLPRLDRDTSAAVGDRHQGPGCRLVWRDWWEGWDGVVLAAAAELRKS